MQDPQDRVFQAVRATQRFLDTHADALAGADVTSARRVLDDVAEQLELYACEQLTGARMSREETAKQHALRKAIRFQHMRPLAAIARRNLRMVPECIVFKVPPNSVGGQRFIAAALDMAKGAEARESLFRARGMPAGFVERMREATDELARSYVARSASTGHSAGASAGIATAVQEARTIFRVLDALVRPALASDVDRREWEAAKLIVRRARPKTTDVERPAAVAAVTAVALPPAPEPAAKVIWRWRTPRSGADRASRLFGVPLRRVALLFSGERASGRGSAMAGEGLGDGRLPPPQPQVGEAAGDADGEDGPGHRR